jgi:hypothetical protein
MGPLFKGRVSYVLGALVAWGGGSAQSIAAVPGGASGAADATRTTSGSWMLAQAAHHKLLYISDPTSNAVYVYIYPRGSLVGTLTGFNEPWGLCADRAGNVFVADVWNERLVEYAHGGVAPIAMLSDNGGHPTSCSVDPNNGNLAAVYYFLGKPNHSTELAVYAGAQGNPRRYGGSRIGNSLWSCAYDDHDNVFVDGLYGYVSLSVGLAELPRGENQLVDISLGAHIARLSSLQWTGKHLAIGDQGETGSLPATIYQLSLSGTNTSKVGTTQLANTYGMQQFWVQRDNVAAASESTSTVYVYAYPGGGTPTRTITGVQNPFGITVSRAK